MGRQIDWNWSRDIVTTIKVKERADGHKKLRNPDWGVGVLKRMEMICKNRRNRFLVENRRGKGAPLRNDLYLRFTAI
jgi:hypothetical protein